MIAKVLAGNLDEQEVIEEFTPMILEQREKNKRKNVK